MVDDYYSFKQDLLFKTRGLSLETVRTVVNEYEKVIDSKRRSSCIKNCNDLILILEKRCHVCPEDYYNLEKIINYLPEVDRSNMLARLNRQRPAPTGFSNYNGSQNTSTHSPMQTENVTHCKLPDSVLTLISEEIGVKWRDFARKLEIREGDLRTIEKQFGNNYKQCAYESLLLYQSRSTKHNLRTNLLQALEKARRKDLQHDVQRIFEYMD